MAKSHFAARPPQLALAMGGFTSAPPILAARQFGARTFLHESNSIPGRANRWLAPRVDGAFISFPAARNGLRARRLEVTGTPVRSDFLQATPPAEARAALGLKADDPVLLVMGGSQGAHTINERIVAILPRLRAAVPALQFVHLTGPDDLEMVRAAYAELSCPAFTRAFLDEMAPALAAADLAVTRAGASSLAELAACRLPAILIPYPTAADNHQYFNALAFARSGAARLLPQDQITPELLTREITGLLDAAAAQTAMRQALGTWQAPDAAAQIADRMLHWSALPQPLPLPPAPGTDAAKLGVLNV
jgi:UDP-N-acetylglucosamine--N-acetylmuramyl-(pentapeptide) pyrophosphoryl-undecaprenol N-acetylglucosamine transferase